MAFTQPGAKNSRSSSDGSSVTINFGSSGSGSVDGQGKPRSNVVINIGREITKQQNLTININGGSVTTTTTANSSAGSNNWQPSRSQSDSAANANININHNRAPTNSFHFSGNSSFGQFGRPNSPRSQSDSSCRYSNEGSSMPGSGINSAATFAFFGDKGKDASSSSYSTSAGAASAPSSANYIDQTHSRGISVATPNSPKSPYSPIQLEEGMSGNFLMINTPFSRDHSAEEQRQKHIANDHLDISNYPEIRLVPDVSIQTAAANEPQALIVIHDIPGACGADCDKSHEGSCLICEKPYRMHNNHMVSCILMSFLYYT